MHASAEGTESRLRQEEQRQRLKRERLDAFRSRADAREAPAWVSNLLVGHGQCHLFQDFCRETEVQW